MRAPRQVAPYHLRLDWLLWFVPLGGVRHDRWLDELAEKLLAGDRAVGKLFRVNPFRDQPPKVVRARLYRYAFARRDERRSAGTYWERTLIRDLLEVGEP
jgi:hypothetical protein